MTNSKNSEVLNTDINMVGKTLELMGFPHKIIVAILTLFFNFDFSRLKEGSTLDLLVASDNSVDASVNEAERHNKFGEKKLCQLPLNIVKGSSLSIWEMT